MSRELISARACSEGMKSAVLAVLVLTGGCNSGGLSALTERCTFAFGSPAMMGEAACSMEHNVGGIMFVLGGDHPVMFSVSTAADSGYARLEATTTIRSQPGEVYGLTSLEFDGCNDWGGHAEWITANGWQLKLISTCSRSSGALLLNGTITKTN